MSNTPTLTSPSFDPEAIKVLTSAFDEAWGAVQRSGGTLSRPAYARIIREVLAKRIIEMAQHGQSDARSLSDDAVQYLASNYKD